METTTRSLKCKFTQEELDIMKTDLAAITSELRSKEEEKRAVASQFKSEIDGLVARTNVLADKINNGYEFRPIECDIDKDMDSKIMTVIRRDTGEVIEQRPLQDHELQSELNF